MATNVIMPQMGESIFEGTLTKWLKKEGDKIKRDEPLFEISTDKVDTEIPAPAGGILQKILIKEGATVQINTVVAVIAEEGSKASPVVETKVEEKKPAKVQAVGGGVTSVTATATKERLFSSPLVRRIAREENIDLKQIAGSGFNGRITKQDILSYIGRRREAGAAVTRIEEKIARPIARPTGKVEVIPMGVMRQKIADHMVMSRQTSAHVTTVFEIDLSKIAGLYNSEKEYFQNKLATKLTYTHFFAKAVIDCIKEFPLFNSSVEGTNIVIKHYINLGIAVALPEGLIVPVVKNTDEKSFLELTRAINDIADRARSKKLLPDDVQGGTFTITNPGIYGGLFGTPIINQPQVAILGIGGIKKRAVVIETPAGDSIAIKPMLYMGLSFDHRLIDGALADQFMARLKQILESWSQSIK